MIGRDMSISMEHAGRLTADSGRKSIRTGRYPRIGPNSDHVGSGRHRLFRMAMEHSMSVRDRVMLTASLGKCISEKSPMVSMFATTATIHLAFARIIFSL